MNGKRARELRKGLDHKDARYVEREEIVRYRWQLQKDGTHKKELTKCLTPIKLVDWCDRKFYQDDKKDYKEARTL